MNKIETLVIPAAGAAVRLRPMTQVLPKEMLRLVDRPIAYYLLAEAHLAGMTKVIFVIHRDNTFTREFFESPRAEVLLKDFPGLQLSFLETDIHGGDGQALLLAREAVGNNFFAVSMGDAVALPGTSILKDLIEAYEKTGETIISVTPIAPKHINQYGVIKPGEQNGAVLRVEGMVEKPAPEEAPSNLGITGKYILSPAIFSELEALQGNQGELKLSHALNSYSQKKPINAMVRNEPHYDTGTKINLLVTEITFSLAHPELKDSARLALEMLLK